MVVSNDGFYFQEYFDPRKQLESAGAVVRVASGLGEPAYPHPGSYQPHKDPANDFGAGVIPTDEGARVIPATERLSELQADNFDGLVIVGGWGASRYFFAYPGTYGGPVAQWAPDPAQATGMNRLVDTFVTAHKRILAVCNGVNVQSWARVDGASPLAGNAVSAPWAAAPPQTYPHPYPAGPLVAFSNDYQVDRPCPPDPLSNCFPMDKIA
jgi:putative intracellular protease/amidase